MLHKYIQGFLFLLAVLCVMFSVYWCGTQQTSTAGIASEAPPRAFLGEELVFYGEQGDLYLELSLNRKQKPNGTYKHYYFLHGLVDGKIMNEHYTADSSETSVLNSSVLTEFEHSRYADLSSREQYRGVLEVLGIPVDFETDILKGDFVTKNTLDYTRYHSAGDATLTVRGQEYSAQVILTSVYSSDYSQSVFFSGYDDVETEAYQFILWDSVGNLYVVDRSEVSSDTPAYPSHAWTLFKDARGQSSKGFEVAISEQSGVGWDIQAPLFGTKPVRLPVVRYLEQNSGQQDRSRALVRGVVDIAGVATPIGGLMYTIGGQ